MSIEALRPQLIAGAVSTRLETATSRVDIAGDPVSTWTAFADLASGVELGSRRRFELRRLADFCEVYLSLFLPPETWQLGDVTGDGELMWTSGAGSFGDVLVASGPDAAVYSREARSASFRLLAAGVAPVRLVKLAAPFASLLRTSRNGPPSLLVDSDLWFGPAFVDPADVVSAAIGGGP